MDNIDFNYKKNSLFFMEAFLVQTTPREKKCMKDNQCKNFFIELIDQRDDESINLTKIVFIELILILYPLRFQSMIFLLGK